MNLPRNVLLFGGTGHLGRDVARALLTTGASLCIASRQARSAEVDERIRWTQADLVSGRGVSESLRGGPAVVFCAGAPKQHAAVEVDGLRRLLDAARAEGVAHFVFISIVGIDHLPVPYYRTKLAAEQLIRESGVPFTILRATQFHYFLDRLLATLARTPWILPVPKGFRVQPVATEEVAARLVRCLADGPQGMLRDYCGPQVLTVAEAAELWTQARGIRRRIVPVPIPGRLGAAFRQGHNTNAAGELGVVGWAEWLSRRS